MINLGYIKRLMRYLRKHTKDLFKMFGAIAAGQVCALFLPKLMANIIDIGIKRGGLKVGELAQFASQSETLGFQSAYILKTGALMLLFTALSGALTVYSGYVMSRLSAKISACLRADVFKKIMSFSYKEFDEIPVSSLITRATNDVEHVKDLIIMFTQTAIPPLVMVGGAVMAFRTCADLSPIIVFGALASGAVIFVCFMIIMPKLKILQKLADKFNLVISQRLSGIMLTHAFGNEGFEEHKFNQTNSYLTNTSLFVSRVTMCVSPVLTAIMNISTVSVLWFGASKIKSSTLQIGEVMAFVQYGIIVISAFLMLSVMAAMIPKAFISVQRVFEILDKSPEKQDSGLTYYPHRKLKGFVKFENASFKYDNAREYILKNVNFEAAPGQVIGVTGPTGSGKSTFLKLICGLYEASDGKITLDGINIKNIHSNNIYENISYVSQKSTLFKGDVPQNLKLGNETASDAAVYEALKAAQAYDFVFEKSENINCAVKQGGINFSGGQKQRLAIARALVKKPCIYLLDDIFSQLDFKTDSLLRKSLFEYTKNSLVIIVSQRINTISSADKILVFDKGTIINEGTHDSLLGSCKIYREMTQLQKGAEVKV